MVRLALALLFLAAPAFVSAAEPIHQVKLNGHTFTLPFGFEIELVASAPQVERPIAAAFDDTGRLYVCDSSGSNARPTEQVKTKPHRIVRLESTKRDGKFDKATVFVKNIMFPEGALWLNGSLYVAAPPHIWKFTDTKDTGVADKEEIWFDGKTLTGCANDLHGPYRGPDGDIYWCKGAFARQEYTLPDGKKFSTRAAHIFRARPDGTHIEPVMTGGMDNPVGVAFTPGGERIFSTTFFQHPGDGKRDGLVHAVYGAVYGKDHDPVYEHPWTSPQLMPPMTHMSPAAPCGLHRYESDQFGKDYENNLFCTQFNMRKVSRHVLVSSGSTFTTKDSDFVVSDNIDFHPTDVLEDADGSLLILDTGGWYKLCCPTSQLVKPDVLGAIYRVRKTGAHKVDDPWGEKIEWKKLDKSDLGQLLDDPRPVVQRRAIDQVQLNGFKALQVIVHANKTSSARLNSVWLAVRDQDHEVLAYSILDQREDVRKASLHGLALLAHPTDLVTGIVEGCLKDNSLAVRRVAAEALGRMKAKNAIPAILEALAYEANDDPFPRPLRPQPSNKANDRVLDHSLTYALIEIGDAKATSEGLKHPSPRVRRAVLAALENIPESKLDAKTVLAAASEKDAALRETAWWIAGRHPEWADQLAGYFQERLARIETLTPPEQDELVSRLVPFLKTKTVSKIAGDALKQTKDPMAVRAILRGLARSGVKTFPEEWLAGVMLALNSPDHARVRDAIAVLRAVPPTAETFSKVMRAVDFRVNAPDAKESSFALRATAPIGSPLADIADLIAGIHRDQPGPVRGAAADVLGRSTLSPSSLIDLAGALKTVNPLEMPRLLQAFTRSTDEKVGLALVKALRDPAVRPSIRAEMVKPILDKYPMAVREEAETLYTELALARKDEQARLEKMLAELKPGDVRRGQLVFNSPKTQCIACHKVGYVGGSIGPDLTRIGSIRTERDLLEAIVFPSASFVRSYEPMRVLTTDDRTLNGIIKKDAPDEIVIAVAADKEERIARADIASITPSSVSLMPSGLDQQLSQQDLADLIAFLKACR